MSLFSDERPVRDSERKNQKYHFQLKDYKAKEMMEMEMEIGSLGKSDSYTQKTSAKAHLDFNLSSSDFSKLNDRENEHLDNLKRISPSKYQTDEHQPYVQPHSDFDDEYRPLPSPPRSSMRSSSPTSRAKDGHRVTFVDSSISELFPKTEDLGRRLESDEDLICTGKTTLDKPASAFNFKNTYLTSTPVRKESAGSERIRVEAGVFQDVGQSAESRDRLKPPEESSRDRLLRLSSDLYVTTHLTDPITSSNSLSALRKGFTDVSKTYTLPSKPTLASTHQSTGKTLSRPDFTRGYKNSWSPDRPPSITDSLSMPQNGLKKAGSLNSLLSPKVNGSDYLTSVNELKKSNGTRSSEAPSINDILHQLMDLVDRYWNGSGSLLLNQRFLVPARDLLSRLMSVNQMSPVDSTIRHGPDEDRETTMIKIMEENHFLRTKVFKLENQAACKEGSGGSSFPQDDLHQKYEQLRLQVESLQQQLEKTNKLQETVNQLHHSQRSLVCTNEYLVQQLNKISPTTIFKPPSPDRSGTDRYVYSEAGAPTSHGAGHYRTLEKLSLCPL